jgi:hypothetical protein
MRYLPGIGFKAQKLTQERVMFKVDERYRVKVGMMASSVQEGNNGCFIVPHPKIKHASLFCIVHDGVSHNKTGWEHVSVSIRSAKDDLKRCPTWDEMCLVKDVFWDTTDMCVQYHPAEEDYISNHKYCLHIWRPVDQALPKPSAELIGVQGFVNK